MENVVEITDSNFDQQVLKSNEPVLVDFWAPWCGPCRMIAPLVEELAGENRGSIKVGKVNIDDNPAAAQNYGVSSIPTLMLFKGGQLAATKVGALSKSQLTSFLDGHL